MIYLSFNDTSLLCSIIVQNDGKTQLSYLNQIPLTGNLDEALGDDSLFNEILEIAFKSLTSEVQIDGHDVTITIPDYWVHHDFTVVDSEMGMDDSWEFILWQKQQRFGESSIDFFTFAESIQNNIKHIIHVPNQLITEIKLNLIDFGAKPVWLGTESMVFTGLSAQSYGIIHESGSGYDVFFMNENNLFAGNVRYVKGRFKAAKSFGFQNQIEELLNIPDSKDKKIFGPVYALSQLSATKQKYWERHQLKYISPFQSVAVDDSAIYKGISAYLLSIQSIIVDRLFPRSELNLLAASGPVARAFERQEEVQEILQVQKEETVPEKTKEKKKIDLQKVVVFLTITIILLSFFMSIYLKNMRYSPDFIHKQNLPTTDSVIETTITHHPPQLIEMFHTSNSIKQSVKFLYEKFPYKSISFLSISEMDLQLEILNGKQLKDDLLSLGTMLNYHVQGIECCGGFKHFYDFLLADNNDTLSEIADSISGFQSSISALGVVTEKLAIIDQDNYIQTPFIINTDTEQKMKSVFTLLSNSRDNIVLRKIVIHTDALSGESKAAFYISLFERIRS